MEKYIKELVDTFRASKIYLWKILQTNLKNLLSKSKKTNDSNEPENSGFPTKMNELTKTFTEEEIIEPKDKIFPIELKKLNHKMKPKELEKEEIMRKQVSKNLSTMSKKRKGIFPDYFNDLDKIPNIQNTNFYLKYLVNENMYPPQFILFYYNEALKKVLEIIYSCFSLCKL